MNRAPVAPDAPLAPVTFRHPDQTGAAPVEPVAPLAPVSQGYPHQSGAGILDDVRAWFARYICTMTEGDLDLITLWAVHTHLVEETYTTPRLLIDSPVPGSGKTTMLEHLQRLCRNPVQMASLSSPALLVRMLDAGMRTILIDEADRSLSPDKEGIADLLAVLNTGYKRGATRPVLVPSKKDGWTVSEMPTFSPVAMAGNNPNLPDDTRERIIRVLLLPDIDGRVEESDWERIDDDARALGERIAFWADLARDEVKLNRPPLPEQVKGRARERWSPLKRVAVVVGGRWPAVVDELAENDVERLLLEREEGIVQQKPAVILLTHVYELWPAAETFVATERLIDTLADAHPQVWGTASSFGKRLTHQRLGRMLVQSYNLHSTRLDRTGPRGYTRAGFQKAWRGMGIGRAGSPIPLRETGATGASGETGALDLLPEMECGHGVSTDQECGECG